MKNCQLSVSSSFFFFSCPRNPINCIIKLYISKFVQLKRAASRAAQFCKFSCNKEISRKKILCSAHLTSSDYGELLPPTGHEIEKRNEKDTEIEGDRENTFS
jgi:hypothetical protein